MKRILGLFLLLLPLINMAQDEVSLIQTMHDNVLLVRLKSGKKTVEAMRFEGLVKEAVQVEDEHRSGNERIVAAFKQEFNFCNVLYFYDYNSVSIRNGEFKGVLLDERLKVYAGELPASEHFFIAEFGRVSQREEVYSTETVKRRTEQGVENRQIQYGSSGMGISALVLMDKNFSRVQSPMPGYIRIFKNIPLFKRNEARVVEKMNEKLWSVYRSENR